MYYVLYDHLKKLSEFNRHLELLYFKLQHSTKVSCCLCYCFKMIQSIVSIIKYFMKFSELISVPYLVVICNRAKMKYRLHEIL